MTKWPSLMVDDIRFCEVFHPSTFLPFIKKGILYKSREKKNTRVQDSARVVKVFALESVSIGKILKKVNMTTFITRDDKSNKIGIGTCPLL